MKTLLIDNNTKHLEKLKKLIPNHEVTVTWKNIPSNVSDFDLIILSGSRDSSVVWNHEDFKDEIYIIKNTDKPLIGICFGCELIAYSFNCPLNELKEMHTGIREIYFTDQTLTTKDKALVYEHHRWEIEKLNDTFQLVASSKDCPEIIKHVTRPMYGLQFHPENITDETFGDELFNSVVSKLINNS